MKKNGKIMGLIEKAAKFTDEHQREIMLGGAIAGTVVTAVLSWKAGIKADKVLKEQKAKMENLDNEMDKWRENPDLSDFSEETYKIERREITIETIKKMAPIVAPPALAGAGTIISVIGGYKVASKQIAVLSSLYSMSEKALSDQLEKTKEIVGPKKAQEIKDAVNASQVGEVAPNNANVINTGSGFRTPCFDVASGRFFYSSAEKIRQACNNVNHQIMDEYFVSLNELYDDLGLPPITLGDDLGFTIDGGLIDIDHVFTAKPMEINGVTEPILIFNIDEYISSSYMVNRGRLAR